MSTPPDDTFVAGLVGRPLDEAARAATDAGWLVRPLTPGAMMTMDYREGRVNLEHDADDVVTRAWVG
ncbi:I78 family peptidase inhibitor [Nocardioides sp. YIM 152315]|uniref:I78 family peptidase inhibitor n=1 Tax=Nocardioides sp. YIM 152315 TaxID=3031760 RepID=UPI0023DB4F7B|nr:I78 family peptidase inhibitor [Nocardioides sp. YIM 152315]MDF1605288.1 I78 family peptidase inhibitor [Nocardioides sp. YIM 152315]